MSPATRLISFWGTTKAIAREPSMMATIETNTERKMACGKERLGFFTCEACAAETSIPETMTRAPARKTKLSIRLKSGMREATEKWIWEALPSRIQLNPIKMIRPVMIRVLITPRVLIQAEVFMPYRLAKVPPQ